MLTAHLHCYHCNDTWFRYLTDQETQAYLDEHPNLAEKIRTGEITDVELGEVLCDGCEDFFIDEALATEGDTH